ncbi:integrase, catalytic region, zinc finger, CCHC-type containing protein [Tanacetum coccineum]
MQNPKYISDPTTAIDMALALMAKAFTLNDTTLTNNNQMSSSNPSNMQIAQPMRNVRNQVVQNAVQNLAPAEGNGNGINGNLIRCYNCRGEGHYASNCIVKPSKRDAAYLQQQLQIAQEEEAWIQTTQEEFDFMAAAGACEETKRANANDTLENNLQQASTSGTTSLTKLPFYDLDGSQSTNKLAVLTLCTGKVAKFVRDFKSLAKEADESLAKHKALELEIKHLLIAIVSQDIMSIVQSNSVIDTSNLQTKLDHTKEQLKL